MSYKATNNAFGKLAEALPTDATRLTLQVGQGVVFPVISAPDYTLVTIEDVLGNREIVRVTGRSAGSDALTVVRAQEGTTARSWKVGDVVECRLVASLMESSLRLAEQASGELGALNTKVTTAQSTADAAQSIANAAQSAANAARLGFTPIQQGGGNNQFANKTYIGWGGDRGLLVQVDGNDFGGMWPITALTALNAQNLGGIPAAQFATINSLSGYITMAELKAELDKRPLGIFGQQYTFKTSSVFVVPRTGKYLISVIGAGGGGGAAAGSAQYPMAVATGGGSGGFVQRMCDLVAGQQLNVEIGAGGLGCSARSTTSAAGNGAVGGASRIVVANITLQANGGAGGTANIASSGELVSPATVVGGIATGGDKNINGDDAGSCFVRATGAAATGGAAVGIFGKAYRSGNASVAGAVGSKQGAASGGAGVGARSADASTGVGSNIYGVGGGTAAQGGIYPSNESVVYSRFFTPTSRYIGSSAAGWGGNAAWTPSGNVCGAFAGGGGAFTENGAAAQNGGEAGGGGGGCATYGVTSSAQSGNGGSGFVMIEEVW